MAEASRALALARSRRRWCQVARRRAGLGGCGEVRIAAAVVTKRGWLDPVPKVVDSESRRLELADVTWRLIAEEGFEGTTMRRIAEKANCTTGLVTHYFANKDELLLAAVERVRVDADKRRSFLRKVRPGLPALREFVLTMLPLDEPRRYHWRVWISLWEQGGLKPMLAAEWRRTTTLSKSRLYSYMQEASQHKHLRSGIDLDLHTRTLHSLVYGLALDVDENDNGWGSYAVNIVDTYLMSLATSKAWNDMRLAELQDSLNSSQRGSASDRPG
jgi:AcrR family transcriptional regulator